MRTRRYLGATLCALLSGVLPAGCSTSDPNATPTPSPSPTPGGDSGTFRLTLNMRSGDGGGIGMHVRVLVGDAAYTRANAPYNNGTIAQPPFVSDTDPATFPVDVPAGKTVTLVAIEDAGGLPAALSYDDLDDLIDPSALEFLNWEGVDATPESGVATLLMDRARTVTAVYARMPQVLIRKYDINNPQLAGGCFDIIVEAAERLGLPGADDISGTTENVCCCTVRDNDANLLIAGQVKTGTQITLTAKDSNICDAMGACLENFVEWDGSGALCGGARECMLTVGVDVDVTATWRDNSL